VIAIARDGSLVTRGDANAAQDFEPVSRDRVVGIAVVIVPSGKAVALARQAAE
jgi:hypothetical protein